jgi:F420-non-reducing hydrogenase iron-sulfur subunit
VEYTQGLLSSIGLQAERLRMENLSSAMGRQFADVATAFTEHIQALGPSPLRAAPDSPADAATD